MSATWDRLPCGCQFGTDVINGVETFLFEPHALDCQYYLYVLEESKRQDHPVTTIDLR